MARRIHDEDGARSGVDPEAALENVSST